MDTRRPGDREVSADELHSKADNELESRDQGIFGRVVTMAGLALLLFFIAALLLVHFAGKHIRPVHPDPHPSSEVVVRATEWLG